MKIIASHYKNIGELKVECSLCPANCILTNGKTGICGSRVNIDGELFATNYGELVSYNYDPIEKKPLYHFYPGAKIFSTGANGCNFKCANCQNFEISQNKTDGKFVSPEDLVSLAEEHGSIGIAYTYSEPMIWFEYIMKTGKLMRQAGLKNVLVTNGYINTDPLKELLPFVDAANVDLKGMSPEFYKKVCKGRLQPVLDNIRTIYESDAHLEVTNLVITDLNDADDDIHRLTDFIANLSPKIPLHLSAYYPAYKMNNLPTSAESLQRAAKIAREKLSYVYLGNVRVPGGSDTDCPACGTKIIERNGYYTDILNLQNSSCAQCGYDLNIVC